MGRDAQVLSVGKQIVKRRLLASGATSVLALVALVHCGDPDVTVNKTAPAADPCTTVLQGKCGGACTSTADCGAGLYCSATQQCTAQCAVGASLCGAAACTSDGRCAAGSGTGTGGSGPIIINPDAGSGASTSNGGASACADINLDLGDVIPTVALLIDRSGSMDDYKLDGSKADSSSSSPLRWDALKSGLLGTDSVIKALEQKVRFGMVFYSAPRDAAKCPGMDWGSAFSVTPPADAKLWPPAFNKFSAFDAYFKGLGLVDNTPTAESMTATVNALKAFTEPGPKYVVLATDGDPDRCGAPDAHDATSRDGSVAAVKAAKDTDKIGTFVIGIGKGAVTLDHLQDLANVGAGMPREQRPGAKYYEVGTQSELGQAFDEIVRGVRNCDFSLNGKIDPQQAAQGKVVLDGTPVPFDANNGWKVLDEKTIQLVGDFCTTVKSPGSHALSASFPCNVVLEPPK